jgi:hypothetical protein
MTEGYQDAYAPDDGQSYRIYRLVNRDNGGHEEWDKWRSEREEFVRVPSALAEEVLKGQKGHTLQGTAAQIEKIKKTLQAVLTDAIDLQTGEQHPAHSYTKYKIDRDGNEKVEEDRKYHVKNGHAHDVISADGHHKPAIVKRDEYGVEKTIFAQNGRSNNVIQPDGTFVFAHTRWSSRGDMLSRTSMIAGQKNNLTSKDGQTIFAHESYTAQYSEDGTFSHMQRTAYESYVDDKLHSVTIDGRIQPSRHEIYPDHQSELIEYHDQGMQHSFDIEGQSTPSSVKLHKNQIMNMFYHNSGDAGGSVKYTLVQGQGAEVNNDEGIHHVRKGHDEDVTVRTLASYNTARPASALDNLLKEKGGLTGVWALQNDVAAHMNKIKPPKK